VKVKPEDDVEGQVDDVVVNAEEDEIVKPGDDGM